MTETLVGWHHGRVMTIDDIGHHLKRLRAVDHQMREMVAEHVEASRSGTRAVQGSLADYVPDLLNEIDRLRFLLTERDLAGFAAGVRWAAAEADAQATGREPVAMVDVTDHLRACADNPNQATAVPR